MLSEKTALLNLVSEFIDSNCLNLNVNNNNNNNNIIKAYLKKDENNCYTIYDSEYSIKCIIDKQFLLDYLNNYPSYFNIDNFQSKIFKIDINNLNIRLNDFD